MQDIPPFEEGVQQFSHTSRVKCKFVIVNAIMAYVMDGDITFLSSVW